MNKKTKVVVVAGEKKPAEKEKYAYTITDKVFGELKILASANAWWTDRAKVEQLITAFKLDSTVQEARIYAGISKEQFQYFMEQHPEFYAIREDLIVLPKMKTRKTLVSALDHDLPTARWYAEAKMSDEFGKKTPLAAIQININERMAKKRQEYEK